MPSDFTSGFKGLAASVDILTRLNDEKESIARKPVVETADAAKETAALLSKLYEDMAASEKRSQYRFQVSIIVAVLTLLATIAGLVIMLANP